MALRGRGNGGRRTRCASVEPLEDRRLYCATHAAAGAAVARGLGAARPDITNELAPRPDPTEPTTSNDSLTPVGATPGQVNGNEIFGGGIYGAAAASYTARADGLPLLSSRPAAPFTVFLDFDGWSGNGYGGAQNWQPYDTNANPAAFDPTEAARIAEGWRRIASYMSPFDVNVTTVQPANLNNTTDNWSWSIISNNVSGGFSYLQLGGPAPSAFNQSSDLLGRTSGILHELGHNFSLQHQSIYDSDAVKTTEYRGKLDAIHGVVMGVDFDGAPVKWIYGHPATSATGVQDDVAIIANKIKPFQPAGGDGFRADDVGGTFAAAAALTLGTGGVQSAYGVVERLADADAFSLNSAGGWYTLSLLPDSPSALDGKLEVYDAGGTLLALSDAQTKIDTAVTMNLPAGTFYAVVKSHGNYGDIGAYEMRVAPANPVAPPGTNALPAPANVATTLGTGTDVVVSWSAVAGATSYVVERSLDGVLFTTAATAAGSATSYTDANLAGSHRCVYRVRAGNATGVGAASLTTAIVNRPSSVNNRRYTQTNGTQIVLDWLERPESGGETGYRIERSTDNVNFVTAGSVGPNVVIFSDTGLAVGQTYYYRIVPTSAAGDGPTSTMSGITTRLGAVAGLTFTGRTSTSLSLQWTDQSAESGYRIERSSNGSTWTTIANNAANQRTYVDSGLSPGAEYYYRVTGTDSNGVAGLVGGAIFSATPAASAPGAPWSNADIGAVSSGGVGASSFNAGTGTFTLIAGGFSAGDGDGTDDRLRFTHQAFTGDGAVIARVSTLENTNGTAKAGVMFRESTAVDSRVAFVSVTPTGGAVFTTRATAGEAVTETAVTSIGGVRPVAPYWVKLQRAGNVFTAFASANGVTWTQVGSPATIAMPATARTGIAATSNNSSLLNTSTLDNVSVRPPNTAPVAANDTLTVGEDLPGISAVLANDADANGDTLTITGVSSPAHGTATLNLNKTITYRPAANYNGPDSFTYAVSDGFGGTATATVSVTVTPANDAPTAGGDTATLAEDASAVAINVLANDGDVDGDALAVSIDTSPAHGAVVVNANKTISYTPAANYYGADSFAYIVSDGKGGSAAATVSLTVTPVNDAPTLDPIAGQSAEAGSGSHTITLTGIGTGAANEVQNLTILASSNNTSVTPNPIVTYHGDGTATLSYTPGAVGTATITVAVQDDGGTANGGVNATSRTFVVMVEAPAVVTPAWLGAGSVAAWNAGTHTLTVSGAARIVADPLADLPTIVGDGASAVLTIDPGGAASQVNIGGLTLANGATAVVNDAVAGRVLVVHSGGVNISGVGSALDLADNDMIVHGGGLPPVQPLIASGFAGGAWTGAGIRSSAAAADGSNVTALGYADNASMGLSEFSGVTGLTGNEILVKYTYYGDTDLSGVTDTDDFTLFLNGFQDSANFPATWLFGDFDSSGTVDTDDFAVFLHGRQDQLEAL